jgi:hypothetical protein
MSHSFKHSFIHSFCPPSVRMPFSLQTATSHRLTCRPLTTQHPEFLVTFSFLLAFGYAAGKVVFKQSNLYYADVLYSTAVSLGLSLSTMFLEHTTHYCLKLKQTFNLLLFSLQTTLLSEKDTFWISWVGLTARNTHTTTFDIKHGANERK